MKCKFCEAELSEDVTVCPECGMELAVEEQPAEEIAAAEIVEEIAAEETADEATEAEEPAAEAAPAKKKRGVLKVILAVAGVLVLALLLTWGILSAMGLTDEVTGKLDNFLHSAKFWRDNDLYYKKSYTADDAAAEEKVDEVVAVMGDQKLTNGELQVYYWQGVFDFLDYYGYYLSMMGISLDEPLDQQIADQETGMTYQQMFLENALESWRRYATLVQMSQRDGFVLTQEQQTELDSFRTLITEAAAENGYDDPEKFVDEQMFPGSSVAAYAAYNRTGYIGVAYYDTLYDSLLPDQAEIEAYYAAHEAEFTEKGLGKDAGDYYDVRHILVAIEGGTKGEDGKVTYSDADWEACRTKAQKMLDDFLAGEATEEAFAALAKEKSADPGSSSNGGLYTQLTKSTSFIEGFKNWYLEEGRKVGDTGLVKNTESSTQGYHIMYFSGSRPIWEQEAESAALSDNTSKLLEDAQEQWPMKVDYKKIVLGHVDLKTG